MRHSGQYIPGRVLTEITDHLGSSLSKALASTTDVIAIMIALPKD
jgi:hypothetical protein